MQVPLELAITAIVLCSGLALFVGICLRPDTVEHYQGWKAHFLDAIAMLNAEDQPRRLEFTPEVAARLSRQEREARYLPRPNHVEWTPAVAERFRQQRAA